MVGILIVDDDALVRMFLKQIVPWENHGYTIVGDARDGEEALEKMAERSPDILLTDLSMTGMDGLTLIERAKENGFDGGVIVLSCHEDFSCVKTALQLGADEYLLKNHLSETELLRVIDGVREKMEQRRHRNDRLETYARKGMGALQHELLETMLGKPDLSFVAQQEMTAAAGLHGRYYSCAVLLVQLPAEAAEKAGRLTELCGQFAGKYCSEAVRFRRDCCALLVDLSEESSAAAQTETIRALCAAAANYAERYLGASVSIGISRVCTGEGGLHTALREAGEALMGAFYGTGMYRSDELDFTAVLPDAAEYFERALGERIRWETAEQIANRYAEALAQIKETRVQPGTVLHWLRRCDLAAGIVREEKEYAGLRTFVDYIPLKTAFAAQAEQFGTETLPADVSAAIRTAVRYIRENFSEQLMLAQVAEEAGLTQNYFSSLFKQEVGVGFSTYLTDCRLQYVCRRLEQGNEIIKQIAADAGFLDYQHFCRTFKKHFDVSPAEYRRSRLAEKS